MSAMSPDQAEDSLWFVRQGAAVRGPLHWRTIEKDRLLGRILPDAEVCGSDGRWQPISEPVDLPLPWTVGIRVIASGSGKADATPSPDTVESMLGTAAPARAQLMRVSTAMLARRARATGIWASLRENAPPVALPLLAVALVLLTTILLAIFGGVPRTVPVSDCATRPAAGGTWDFCMLATWQGDGLNLNGISARSAYLAGASFVHASLNGADLSYADLTRADLSLADLRATRMVGARLQQAALNHARMRGADLRFADLSGADLSGTDLREARLGYALWSDGRVCAPHAVGTC